MNNGIKNDVILYNSSYIAFFIVHIALSEES